jgi:Protein of unknown function (DUF1449)
VNLPFTALLGLIVLYWLLVALGALDVHLFSDVHTDGHVEGDVHHGGGDHDTGGATKFMDFVGIGDVPVMVIVSVLGLSMWLGSMLSNYYITGGSQLLALAMLLPIFLVSVVVTRYVTMPLRPLFRLINKDRGAGEEVLGSVCLITTSEATPTFGQAEITRSGAPVLINVRTLGDAVLVKGARAAVVRSDAEKGVYYITPMPAIESSQTHNNP